MSFCPVCDELISNRDILALGCGHILCQDCITTLLNTTKMKECPLCKQRIYDSEIRKVYLNEVVEKCRFL